MSQVNPTDNLPPRPAPNYWTASRCNRTLRKINLFVSQLEKWQKDYVAFKTNNEKVAEKDEEQDADWLSTGLGKAAVVRKKTYASRHEVPTTPVVKYYPHGPLSIRTPKASVYLKYEGLVPVADKPVNDDCNGSQNNLTSLQDYDMPLGNPKVKENTLLTWKRQSILRHGKIAIEQFLVATSDPRVPGTWNEPLTEKQMADKQEREIGAKSLVSMCLVKLSEIVVDEQKESDANKDGYDGECDVMGSQLQELEDYFGRPTTGWPYLRDVTRSYGIALVARLVKSGAMYAHDARDIAVAAFESPLLADFGEAITDTLIRMDIGRKETFLERGGTPGFGAYGDYNCDVNEIWREIVKFRWLTQAIRQEADARFVVKHICRFDALRNAYTNHMFLHQVSAAELIETTFFRLLWQKSRDLQEDLRHRTHCIRTGAQFDWDKIDGEPIDDILENRLSLVVRMFFSDPREWTFLLIGKMCTQIQLSMEWSHIQSLPRFQKLVIAQIFFVEIGIAALYRRNVRKSLLAYFDALLSDCDGTLVYDMQARMVAILLGIRSDGSLFMESIMRILGIQCAENELVHQLLARVCAEAAMDYATEQIQQDISAGFWASQIEAQSRNRNEGPFSNKLPPSVQQAEEEPRTYQWDHDLSDWVEATPEKPREMRLLTRIQQLDGTCESPPLARRSRLPKKQAIRPEGHGLKRKKSLYTFEVHRDNEFDFEYKKPKLIVPKSLQAHAVNAFKGTIPNRRRSAKLYDEEESEDELSLLD